MSETTKNQTKVSINAQDEVDMYGIGGPCQRVDCPKKAVGVCCDIGNCGLAVCPDHWDDTGYCWSCA